MARDFLTNQSVENTCQSDRDSQAILITFINRKVGTFFKFYDAIGALNAVYTCNFFFAVFVVLELAMKLAGEN